MAKERASQKSKSKGGDKAATDFMMDVNILSSGLPTIGVPQSNESAPVTPIPSLMRPVIGLRSAMNDAVADSEKLFDELKAVLDSDVTSAHEKEKAIDEFLKKQGMGAPVAKKIGFFSCIADGLGMIKNYLKSKNNTIVNVLPHIFLFFVGKTTAIRKYAENNGYTLGDFKDLCNSEKGPCLLYPIVAGFAAFSYIALSMRTFSKEELSVFYGMQYVFLPYFFCQSVSLLYELGRYKKLHGVKK